jgi:hypothetical protein
VLALQGRQDERPHIDARDVETPLSSHLTPNQRHITVGSLGSGQKPRRPGVKRLDRALRHVGKGVAMPEGQVIPARGANLAGIDGGGAIRGHVILHKESMAEGDVPRLALSRRQSGQRTIGRFVLDHAAAPQDEVVFGQVMPFAAGMSHEQQIGASPRQVDLAIDGLRVQAIMVPGDHDHRAAGTPNLLDGEIDHIARRSIRVEEVSGDEQQVNIFPDGDIDDRAEGLMGHGTVMVRVLGGPIVIDIEMDVGGV